MKSKTWLETDLQKDSLLLIKVSILILYFLRWHQLPLTYSASSALQWIRNNSGNIVSARVKESEAKIKTEKEAGWRSVWTSGVRTQVCLVHWWLWRIHCSMSSHCTWVTGPCSRRHPSLYPTTSVRLNLTRAVLPVMWVRRKKRGGKKLKSGVSHQILCGPWTPIIQSLSFQLGWSQNE